MKVFITSMGAISSIGNNIEETYNSLINERTGIKKKSYPSLRGEFYTGEINLNNTELAKITDTSDSNMSRNSLIGIKSALECWGKNTFNDNLKTGLISGTSVGGMDKSEVIYRNLLSNDNADISDFKYHDSGSVTEKIADRLNFKGYVNTISTACSSSSNSIMLGARLIKSGKLDRVLVGGVDALSEFTISGFKSLMIYNENWCAPFDQHREGLNLGEAAGFILLESEESIKITKNKILAELTGYENSSDAFHQTATSPDAKGASIAMSKALEKAKLKPEDIDYVSAHGTGTKNNDLTESIAFKKLFQDNVPPFSSTKSYTGHTLAASGVLEIIFSILSIQNKVLFPNLNYKEPIEETQLTPIKSVIKNVDVNHVLSNAFGFGGNCTSLIISKA